MRPQHSDVNTSRKTAKTEGTQYSVPLSMIDKVRKPLLFNEGDTLSAGIENLRDANCQEIHTKGDGACAVHAVFGCPDPKSQRLEIQQPRQFLRNCLDHSVKQLQNIVRPNMVYLVESVGLSLWQDFVEPYLTAKGTVGNAPHEESMFLDRLCHPKNARLLKQVTDRLKINNDARLERTAMTHGVQKATRSVFTMEAESLIWKQLAVRQGLLPQNVENPVFLTDAELVFLEYDFLHPPWETRNGVRVVKGTKDVRFVADEHGGPLSKYAALFDERGEFDVLRHSFLTQVCGDKLEHLADKFGSANEKMSTTLSAAILAFWDDHLEPFQTHLQSGPPPSFFESAWPILVECMCDESIQYYLSYTELLLVCEIQRTNVIVFGTDDECRRFLGSSLGHAQQPPVMITLNVNDGARVRSHFQRLILASTVSQTEERETRQRDARRRQEELVRQAQEERSQETERTFTDQLEQEASAVDADILHQAHEESLSKDLGDSFANMDSDGGEETKQPNDQPEQEADQETDQEPDPQEAEDARRVLLRKQEWLSMFHVRVAGNRSRVHVHDLRLQVAERIAEQLRAKPTVPANPENKLVPWTELQNGGRLAPVSCAFQGCCWQGGTSFNDESAQDDTEHPWDQQLRKHILDTHGGTLQRLGVADLGHAEMHRLKWDLYKQAIAVLERRGVPSIGTSIDRRTMEHLVQVYNDRRIKSLICFCCAQIHVDTGRLRSRIKFLSLRWFLGLPLKSISKNFSMSKFNDRYRKSGTPLAFRGPDASPDFSDWSLMLTKSLVDAYLRECPEREDDAEALRALTSDALLCCPEDLRCLVSNHGDKDVCLSCQIPICKFCQVILQRDEVVPLGLANDNWHGYIKRWIYEVGVTWMEKTVSTPYWTGLTLFSVSQLGRRKHLMHDRMYQNDTRIAFKGQVYSAPMDWRSTIEQLEELDASETHISLPIVGAVLAHRVQIQITAGLIELNKHIKQATVRRPVVVQLIRMHQESGHSDFQNVDMASVELQAKELAETDEATIPSCLTDILQGNDQEQTDVPVDKAATPAERVWTQTDLKKTMDRARPLLMVAERDSDARKEVEASRSSAFAQFSTFKLQTGSALIDQFKGSYVPRVYNLTLPWFVGGPDLKGQERLRRTHGDESPAVFIDMFTAMMARRVEAQMRWDWDFLPALWSLTFATQVNLGVALGIKRALRKGEDDDSCDKGIGDSAAMIYKLLWSGEYMAPNGKRTQIKGDVSKLPLAIGLTPTQKALLMNYRFLSSRIPGTRQIRRQINHLVFSARVFYGLPVFLTVTPSERHNGLMIRLTRYRRNDPAIQVGSPEFLPWIGHDKPSLQSPEPNSAKDATEVDLPEFDLRRMMTSRDPLCSVNAFRVSIGVVIAGLYGLRMCPDCPNCNADSHENFCMDEFGSNATPMGGSIGRADAMIGAVENQKAEGVLHLHFFVFLQMVHQFANLAEIGQMLKDRLLSIDELKAFVDHARCAKYPDVQRFEQERNDLESMWPVYAKEDDLCRAPHYIWESINNHVPTSVLQSSTCLVDWRSEGNDWTELHRQRLQYVLSHMNHHIHPLVNTETGERRPLAGCQPKNRPKECKGGFPLADQMTDIPLLICKCIALDRKLPTAGSRSCVGCILPSRNNEWLNAAPPTWSAFSGDNGDIKFAMRVPILAETHETLLYDVRRCCEEVDELEMMYQVQAGQATTAGYFGGYSAKMQPIGQKELKRMEESLSRKISVANAETEHKTFQNYSRRLVRDLEGKGTLRTSTEGTNLSVHANCPDLLSAECIRTFPSVVFPAILLLKREEIETRKTAGVSVIAAVHSCGRASRRAFVQPPFDIMYGFRGSQHVVDILSPYEMIMHWALEEIRPPTIHKTTVRSKFTTAGFAYKEQCRVEQCRPEYKAGEHYEAVPSEDRILMPAIAALGNLRHRWAWQQRLRLHLPTWSFAKIPKGSLSPEENARLLSIYLRPWTLHPADVTTTTPLLSTLRDCLLISGKEVGPPETTDGQTEEPPKKRRRLNLKQSVREQEPQQIRKSYAASWMQYVDGNIVSETSRRYILNLLSCTAARVVERTDGSSDESEESDLDELRRHAGDLAVVHNTLRGLAANDEDEGSRGFGRHASSIRLGRALWESASLSQEEKQRVSEPLFDDGTFPDTSETLKAAQKMTSLDDERPAAFQNRTEPFTHLTVKDYGKRIRDWLTSTTTEKEPPTTEQRDVLNRVADRVLQEFALEHEGQDVPDELRFAPDKSDGDEPLRGLVHGLPGTGKSRVIKWIRRLFEEALGWEHGVQFVCVAFQNRMAASIGGNTLHSAADLPRPGTVGSLSHSDIDNLYIKNQCLRWVLVDEVSMIPDELLGCFERNFRDAAIATTRYKKRRNKSIRIFGGYNFLFFGDLWQLPPIPDSSALFKPPDAKSSATAKVALELFWGDGDDALNYLAELTIQKRVEDPWYSDFLSQCRDGKLDDEHYHFLMGMPTRNPGSWRQAGTSPGHVECKKKTCQNLGDVWSDMAKAGATWETMGSLECDICAAERARRNRLVDAQDPRTHKHPFLEAPYVHKYNVPKYHALLLRAVEFAKRGGVTPKHILWVVAQDTPHNPHEIAVSTAQMERKRTKWLQFHDQKTSGLPGLLPLYEGMPARVTERISAKFHILKHSPCKVVGWDLHPADRQVLKESERVLKYLPACIYVKFAEATWRCHPDLEQGVFPMKSVRRDWEINKVTETKANRRGFRLLPDFASTAHMVQGANLDAVVADCGDLFDNSALKDMLASYVALSRVKRAETLLLLRAFCVQLFRHGPPPGPQCLMKLLRARLVSNAPATCTRKDAVTEYERLTTERTEKKQRCQEKSQTWRCFDCHGEYPAEGFGVNAAKEKDVFEKCVAPGHWLACVACVEAHRLGLDRAGGATGTRACTKCEKTKDGIYFLAASTVCRACMLQRSFRHLQCKVCHIEKPMHEYPLEVDRADAAISSTIKHICIKCVPRQQKYICTVCHLEQDRQHFSTTNLARQLKTSILRCNACFTCGACDVRRTDGRAFATNSKLCWRCVDIKCDVCKLLKRKSSFPDSNVDKNRKRNSHTRCTACHTCQRCKSETDPKHFHHEGQICRSCLDEEKPKVMQCRACECWHPSAQYDRRLLSHSHTDDRKLVCIGCQKLGCSPKDTRLYVCRSGCRRGHLKFQRKQLDNHKQRGSTLCCTACLERCASITKLLRSKSSWKCTCKTITNTHTEKCKLYPTARGERRWPGKNNEVSEDDLQWLAKHQRSN